MIGTLIGIIIAIFWVLHPLAHETNTIFMSAIIVVVAIPILIINFLSQMWAWVPLQKAERNSTPRILEMFRTDKRIIFAGIWLMAFPIISFGLVSDLLYFHQFNPTIVLAVWVILLGITLDILRSHIHRITSYLNPFIVVNLFTQQAKIAISNNKEIDLCHWIDALSEVAVKGIQQHSTSIGNLALNEQQEIATLFLEASKSLAHPDQDTQTKSLGITDKVSYVMIYMYQRIDMVFGKAIHNRLETTCSHIIVVLGKIAISAAKYDVSLASAPLRFLGKCAKIAQDEGFEETTLTALCTFYEVAKTILNDIDLQYYMIKDTFLSIINGMETLAKGDFRRNKEMDLNLLMQPFRDLLVLFDNPKVKNHQDAPIIISNIKRVLGEFEALQMVMATMPKIPVVEPEKV